MDTDSGRTLTFILPAKFDIVVAIFSFALRFFVAKFWVFA